MKLKTSVETQCNYVKDKKGHYDWDASKYKAKIYLNDSLVWESEPEYESEGDAEQAAQEHFAKRLGNILR